MDPISALLAVIILLMCVLGWLVGFFYEFLKFRFVFEDFFFFFFSL